MRLMHASKKVEADVPCAAGTRPDSPADRLQVVVRITT
jgi:hypothetical protein